MAAPFPKAILSEVEKLLGLVTPTPVIVTVLRNKHGLSEAKAREAIAATWESLRGAPRVDRDAARERMRLALSDFYQKALSAGKTGLPSAFKALEALCKLDGLYEPERLSVDVPAQASIEADPERLRNRIRELIARHPELGVKPPSVPSGTN